MTAEAGSSMRVDDESQLFSLLQRSEKDCDSHLGMEERPMTDLCC